MTDAEFRDEAVTHLKATTISYPRWAQKVAAGGYTPTDGSATEWGKAFLALEKIGVEVPPPPPPPPPTFSVTSTIPNGATLTTPITWEAKASVPVTKVDFSIDGVRRWTENAAPYVFTGDGNMLNPATMSAGTHVLSVVATAADGTTASSSATVTIVTVTPPPPPATSTRILFAPAAGSSLDVVKNTADPVWQKFVNDHYYRLVECWESSPEWIRFYKGGLVYIDSAAVYTNSPEATAHPDWILKDSTGHPVYIPWGAKNPDGTYPQLAADQSNPGFRSWIVGRAKEALAKGYPGIFLDDSNLPYSTDRVPYRNGQPLTEAQQKDEIASAIEYYRAQLGPSVELCANTRWFDDSPNHDATGPYTQRILKVVDWVVKEFGAVDSGLTGGTGTWSMDRLFRYCDNVHAAGKSVVWLSYASTDKDARANLACYLLCKENRDMVTSTLGCYPNAPYPPYSADPGNALGSRRLIATDRWQRDFEHATVVYDHPTRTGTVTSR